MHRTNRHVVVGAVLVAAAFAGTLAGAAGLDGSRGAAAGAEPARAVSETRTAAADLSRAFRIAAERALPGVVYVEVEATRQARIEVPEPFQGTPWQDFFRRSEPAPEPRTGRGSGFVFRSDGYVLTNNHVVDSAERVTVVLPDRREFDARVVGRDPNTDVAVLKIEASGLPVVELGDSDELGVGDWVVALGYPLDLGSTATAGIVSAKGKRLGLLQRNREASAPLEHFIQTDAAINRGNSGGPLIDLQGRAVGISTAIASPTGYFSGYGFAVPINLAKRVAEDLIRHGAVQRPRLGIAIDDVGPADAEVYGLSRPYGAQVKEVQAGSPAERAGVGLGDVIVAVDGRATESSGELMEQLARREPGESVRLDIVRFGERLQLDVELGAFEPAVRTSDRGEERRADGLARLGFAAADLSPALARQLGLDPAHEGVVVTRVAERSPAARVGLARGVVIERLNGSAVASVDELEAAARPVRSGQAVSLVVRLPDGTRTILNYRVRE